jgi:hypothetical protein
MTGTDQDNKKHVKSGRSQRLAAALRENLRRRKAQERGRDAPSPEVRPAAGARDDKRS